MERQVSGASGGIVRIGCGAAFWGDTEVGPTQLVRSGAIDYLVFDYLAEITMSLLSRARAKDPNAGFAADFVAAIVPLAAEIKRQSIKVVANAGGVNPRACQAALKAQLAEQGVNLRIGVVLGDDLMAQAERLRAGAVREMYTGESFPAKPWSINAYLGARPIAAALDAGADIVITGRCVDSAVVLGPLLHEFRWAVDDWDRIAAGTVAGHLLECGTQVTGGLITDWELVADDWDRMGFPIAECRADGTFVVTKPEGTGGLVSPETVAEQLVYEIGDTAAYVVPDVVCDFRGVHLRQVGRDRVEVAGARGTPATSTYKVSATHQDGFRSTGTMMIGGRDAARKAGRVGEAIIARTRRLFAERGLRDYRRTDIEVLGAESTYGAHARAQDTREVILKVAVHHDDRNALELFSREFAPAATSMAQGITGFASGRPPVSPMIRLFSFLVPKSQVAITVEVEGARVPFEDVAACDSGLASTPVRAADQTPAPIAAPWISVPLIALAYGRSGDKGDTANIGVLARRSEFVPAIRAALTPAAVRAYFAHVVQGDVERFELPGAHGFNFLLHGALGGGGTASLRYDPQGKAYAQMLMEFPVQVPAAWRSRGGLLEGWKD
jgi:hypothetical protein